MKMEVEKGGGVSCCGDACKIAIFLYHAPELFTILNGKLTYSNNAPQNVFP
jgi:hypothetical protein